MRQTVGQPGGTSIGTLIFVRGCSMEFVGSLDLSRDVTSRVTPAGGDLGRSHTKDRLLVAAPLGSTPVGGEGGA